MPGSGKSTYIAALRHLLVAQVVPTELQLTGLADEERHLNRLESEWLRCEEVDRTKPATEGWVELHVRNRNSELASTLTIPDLRGETFEQPLCAGTCHPDLYEAVKRSDALLVFTNADREDDATMIADLGDLLSPAHHDGEASTLFRPEDMPEEAKLVEFLQMANRRPFRAKRRKLAIAISAWDVVSAEMTPDHWFAENRPMLDQFLHHNNALWQTRFYGVSAQGGRLPRDRRKLGQIKEASRRIKLVGHGADPHDLTAPLNWLATG